MGDDPVRHDPVKDTPGGVLVIRGGAIGDFILTLPVLAALRRRFPHSRLEYLGSPPVLDLATLAGLADSARSLEARGLAEFFVRGGSLDSSWSRYFAGFSIIISYLHDRKRAFQENVAACSAAEFFAGPHRPDDGSNRHATQVLLEPLKQLAISVDDPVPRLPLVDSPDVPLPAGRWLAVHPGSGSERKNWPEKNWLEFLRNLLDQSELKLLLAGGEAEAGRIERLASHLPKDRLQLEVSSPLKDLAAILNRCRGFVGHDSGITHLAAASGPPVIALWGPTAFDVWRPLGRSVTLLRSPDGIAGISITQVTAEVEGLLRGSDPESR